MLSFLADNWGSITVLLIVAVAVVFVIAKMISDRKKGRFSCGCGCENCPSAGMCHSKTNTNRK